MGDDDERSQSSSNRMPVSSGTLVLQVLQDGIEQLTAKELDEVFRIADHEVARRLARARSKDDL